MSCFIGFWLETDPIYAYFLVSQAGRLSSISALWVETLFLNIIVLHVALYDRLTPHVSPPAGIYFAIMMYLVHNWIPGIVKVRFWIEINFF
jgi:hypothetical protein